MVLFVCVLAGILGMVACMLYHIRISFGIELMNMNLTAHVEIGLLFGLIRIPVTIEMSLFSLFHKIREQQKNSKRIKLKSGQVLQILQHGKKTRTTWFPSFHCRGRIGIADDAFLSVIVAGITQAVFQSAFHIFLQPRSGRISIRPNFESNGIWFYLEGILQIVPTQIIGVLILGAKTRRNKA